MTIHTEDRAIMLAWIDRYRPLLGLPGFPNLPTSTEVEPIADGPGLVVDTHPWDGPPLSDDEVHLSAERQFPTPRGWTP